jgi:ABC-type branched-subunit amino acid transport system permease subunit
MAGMLSKVTGCPSVVEIALAYAVASALALPIGFVGLSRLRSDFLALATPAFGQVTVVVLRAAAPGGVAGRAGVPPFRSPLVRVVSPAVEAMLLTLGLAILCGLAVQQLRKRSFGVVVAAVRVDENLAAAMGCRPLLVKVQVFLLSSFLAALGGAMYAHLNGVVDPRMASVDTTVVLRIGAIISGRRRTWQCAFGAVFVVLMQDP